MIRKIPFRVSADLLSLLVYERDILHRADLQSANGFNTLLELDAEGGIEPSEAGL